MVSAFWKGQGFFLLQRKWRACTLRLSLSGRWHLIVVLICFFLSAPGPSECLSLLKSTNSGLRSCAGALRAWHGPGPGLGAGSTHRRSTPQCLVQSLFQALSLVGGGERKSKQSSSLHDSGLGTLPRARQDKDTRLPQAPQIPSVHVIRMISFIESQHRALEKVRHWGAGTPVAQSQGWHREPGGPQQTACPRLGPLTFAPCQETACSPASGPLIKLNSSRHERPTSKDR